MELTENEKNIRQDKFVELKNKVDFIKSKIEWFCNSEYFFWLISAIVVVFWATKWEIAGFAVLLGISIIIFLTCKNLNPFLYIAATIIMVCSLTQIGSKAFYIFVGIIAPLFFAALIYFCIKNIFRTGKKLTWGKLVIGFVVAGVVSTLGGVGYIDYKLKYMLSTFAMSLAGLAVYLVFLNTVEGDIRKLVSKLIMYACFVIIAEMVIFYYGYYRQGMLQEAFDGKLLRVGWGMTNSMAVFFAMGIPMMIYMSVNSKYNYLYLLTAVVFVIAMFFTFSRGNLIFTACAIPILLIFAFVKTKRKKSFLITLWVFGALAIVFLLVFFKDIRELAEKMIEKGLDDSGRIDLYEHAMLLFKKNPMFGVGFRGDDSMWPGGGYRGTLLKVHCTAIQILMSTGIVGVIGFVPFYIQRYALFLKKFSVFKFFAVASIILYELYGLMDLNFLIFYEILFVIIFSVAAEKETQQMEQDKQENDNPQADNQANKAA